MQPPVLIIEDSPSLAQTYRHFLHESGQEADIAASAEDAGSLVRQTAYGLLLLDLHLPGQGGLDFLRALRAQGVSTPVVVLTAETAQETAQAALDAGADDFISKPVQAARLTLTVRRAQEREALLQRTRALDETMRSRFCDFIGASPAMQVAYRIIETAAQSKAPVFITGESGTGKELAARALHRLSLRAAQPMETLNCAAIPAQLMESEIFGHIKGAFTGATASRTGAAQRAHTGTLFLDELTEMPIDMQAKLLRLTQTGTFFAVGADKLSSADVRFISATNRDPLAAVHDNLLREDLYYRLNVIPLHLPPLRARGQDALLIAQELLARICADERRSPKPLLQDAQDFILSYTWPGNVRELENTLRRAVVLCTAPALSADMLRPQTQNPQTPPALMHRAQQPQAALRASPPAPSIMPLHESERHAIENAIALCGGNIQKAARALCVAPSTLHRKISKWKDL